jgi:hypothetical protein
MDLNKNVNYAQMAASVVKTVTNANNADQNTLSTQPQKLALKSVAMESVSRSNVMMATMSMVMDAHQTAKLSLSTHAVQAVQTARIYAQNSSQKRFN